MSSLKPAQSDSLHFRLRVPELMDNPDLDGPLHHRALEGLRRINSWSRTSRQLADTLAGWAPGEGPLRILDLACGGGDVVLGLERLLDRRGVPSRIDGCDLSPRAVQHAERRARECGSGARFFKCDVLKDPLPDDYDVVISSLFLHHLDEGDAVSLLRRMASACHVGFLVSDLERRRAGYWLAALAPRLLTGSKVVHTDSTRSVRAAFTRKELDSLLGRAGLQGFLLKRHWPCRLLISWRRHS